ncbi:MULTISPECIES: Mrp/NBP35 family ATP-binding protein [Prochlorococcus]|uniref:Mrp/NBP35 family ATP-binding protein n=1 Tax=Prochlorococcus TaxID=1218 RepID=UPI000533BAD1|nr:MULTISPECIES: Mrp/NBP35 family ATP-binding protein [Prochlorococcus]KGG13604.1 Scaffold protein for 4Fe-4S cluster assembly [Prochlorococcus sp. MIT 0601]
MTNAAEAITALSSIKDSGSGKSLIELGWLNQIRVAPPRVTLRLTLPNFAQSQRERIAKETKAVLERLEDIHEVQIELGTASEEGSIGKAGHGQIQPLQSIEGVKNIIAVTSGKGGVGKSTVSVNLACALAQSGYKVGLLDADIYGPNTPTMLGVAQQTPEVFGSGADQKIVPIESFGIAMVSMGFLIDEDQPVIWRGPMLNGIIRQFLYQASWGERDFLVVDMPPGTGDAQLSLAQAVPITGAIIVTTPQKVSLQDARRGLVMFKQMEIPILGVIENMSVFITPDLPQRKYTLFGSGGGEKLAQEHNIPLLSKVPMEIHVLESGNEGAPIVNTHPDSLSAQAFKEISQKIVNSINNNVNNG